MSCIEPRLSTPARDGYDVYYAEKLWSWVPETYRTRDSEPPSNGALRALVEVLGAEAAILRRDIDHLWDDTAIELCDDWAVAYLAALVGARPLSRADPRGARVAAAQAIAWQRRKGTPTVVNMAIHDLAGIGGVVVEAFRRLTRFPHRLDIDVIARGPVTDSPSGGFARMKSPRIDWLTDSAFDEVAHFPDPRRLRGTRGRYGLRKVNLHLFPFLSQQIDLPTRERIGTARYTIDPSGRDVPLFQRGQDQLAAETAPAETDLAIPILCRRFNAGRYRITAEALGLINDPGLDAALAPLLGIAFGSEAGFWRLVEPRLTAAQLAAYRAALLDATLLSGSPKARLWGDSLELVQDSESNAAALRPSAVVAADLRDWQAGLALEPHVVAAFDPLTGRVIEGPRFSADPLFVTRVHLGFFDAIGAIGRRHEAADLPPPDSLIPEGPTGPGGGFTGPGPISFSLPSPLTGVRRFTTSRTHQPALPAGRNFAGITTARLDADDGARPYVRFRPPAATLDITFTAAAAVAGERRELIIDGIWIGIVAAALAAETVASADTPATPVTARLILDGAFDEVILRQVTLDPGGERARNSPLSAIALPLVRLEIEGQVDRLLVERSITGPIWETNADPKLCSPGRIEIVDSIVQSIDPAIDAIQTRLAHVRLVRSTVFGRVEVERLNATDSVIFGRTRVTDNQHGCFRYSATGRDGAVLPPQFEAFVPEGSLPAHWFLSQRFGDPDFAVLSKTAPGQIAEGGENGAEMGAFNARAFTVALDDLRTEVRDLLPVGQVPQLVREFPDHRKG